MQNKTDAGLKVEIWLDLAYHYVICAVKYKSLLLEHESSKNFYLMLFKILLIKSSIHGLKDVLLCTLDVPGLAEH